MSCAGSRLLSQEKIQRHCCETDRNDQPEEYADDVDEMLVSCVAQSQRLEGGLKSVLQMIRKKYKCNKVKDIVEWTPECLSHQLGHGTAIREEARLYEERVDVNDQEHGDKQSGPERDTRGKRTALGCAVHLIGLRSHGPIREPQPHSNECVKEEPRKQDDLKRSQQGIRGHELGVCIERGTLVLFEEEEVNIEVDNQEAEQEEACQRHDDFSADRRSKKGCRFAH